MRNKRITVNTPNEWSTNTYAGLMRSKRRRACSAKSWTKLMDTGCYPCYTARAHQRTRPMTNQIEANSTRI